MRQLTYKTYLLVVLTTLLSFNGVDGLTLGLVLQEIKFDLHLTDTQLGLLGGMAFALFYSLMGVPIARWADRGNRVTIIALATATWSAMVALCGLAATFGQLLLIRVGVAVGEAGFVPPANSLIADYFSRSERPRAVAIYMLGSSFSVLLGYFVAGWLNQLYGWRLTFLVIGLPGIALACLARFTLRDPRGGQRCSTGATMGEEGGASPTLMSVGKTLWFNRSFRHLLLCFSVLSFFGSGIAQWQPSFFIRSYGLSTGELGTWFAALYGVSGLFGTYLGGELCTRFAPGNEALQLRVMALIVASCTFNSLGIYLVTSKYLAFGLIALGAIGSGMTAGPLFATIQTLTPQRMRATSVALVYLSSNLVGLGLGPLVAGFLSDALRPWGGDDSLRYALIALCPGWLWAAWHLLRASETVGRDLSEVALDRDAVSPRASGRDARACTNVTSKKQSVN